MDGGWDSVHAPFGWKEKRGREGGATEDQTVIGTQGQ